MTRLRDPETPYRYDAAHRQTVRENADYRLTRPRTLNGMLRKLTREYAAEPPTALHTQLTDAGGTPTMTGRALAYLGFHADELDWTAIACRRDEDGFYTTPWRCAIERVNDPQRRAFLRDLATNTFFPSDVAAAHGIPGWCATEVTFRSLEMLYAIFLDRPLPGPRKVSHLDKSESQIAAEDAVA
jgi:hypothetical protein